MAVAIVVIGGAAAGLIVAVSGTQSATMAPTILPTVGVLLAGAVAMAATVLGAMAVLEVDARPTRQLRPWKVLLLLPLFLLALQLTRSVPTSAPTATPTNMPALALTLLTLAAAAVVVPLLVRRREAR